MPVVPAPPKAIQVGTYDLSFMTLCLHATFSIQFVIDNTDTSSYGE